MEPVPTSLERIESGLRIVWSDGVASEYQTGQLRDACPCATCREKHKAEAEEKSGPVALPVLSLAEAKPLAFVSMRPVGNYAYNISFSDGHDSGIYTFEYLRQLSKA
ncbi:MAG: DUF971 domain-containing protein [Planctomycetota bacterium]|nr:DUF971 domain-containing protein [Planctomycetota bacterium]